jgi:tetratricopeptide (TPR) repeat protein/predicted aspartyl protease
LPCETPLDPTARARDHHANTFHIKGHKVRTLLAFITALAATALPFSATAQTKCSIGKIIEFPVTMEGLRPIVPATINGHEVRFVADSGAFYSFISPGSAAELSLKLRSAPPGFYVTGVGGAASMSIATAKDFGLGASTLHNIEFLVGGSEVGSTGLLGQNVLGLADVEYDLANAAIRLFKPTNCPHTILAYWAAAAGKPISELDIEERAGSQFHTAGTVILNGVKIRAIFDTGAPVSMLTTAAAARAGVKPNSPGVTSAGSSSGIGRHSVQTWIGAFQALRIGDEEIQKIHLRFGDMGDDGIDMLIGADFFVSHRVYVSNAQRKLYFTYNGGQVFDLSVKEPDATDPEATGRRTVADAIAALSPGAAKPGAAKPPEAKPAGGPEPHTAAEYALRGNARAARLDFVAGLADLTRATELAPDNVEYRYQRAVIRLRTGRSPMEMTMADLDHALKLKPGYTDALLLRAHLRLASGDKAAARADLDAADRALPVPSDRRFELGSAYDEIGDLDAAIPQYDRWIAAHPDDSRVPEALNGRCWARALLGHDLDKAIADCDRALKLRPHTAAFLDSRGLARLRNGDLDKALADYQAALTLEPKLGWSLYGRGIIEQRKGQAAQAKTDIAAAVALEPDLPEKMKKMGLAEASK